MSLRLSLQTQFKGELDAILSEFAQAAPTSDYDDLSDLGEKFATRLITRATAAIERVAGPHSTYSSHLEATLARKDQHDYGKLTMAMGIIEGLRADIEAGFLHSLPELIHGEIFGDFLEMADYLMQEGYKDAAAVIAGSTLESHLRQLCQSHGLSIEVPTPGGPHPKKAEQLNTDLAQKGGISKLDSKNVTAWLGLRNSAAHGKYADYSPEQVRIMLFAVRDFVTRHPA